MQHLVVKTPIHMGYMASDCRARTWARPNLTVHIMRFGLEMKGQCVEDVILTHYCILSF